MALDLKKPIPPQFAGFQDRLSYLLTEYKTPVVIASAAFLILAATGQINLELPSGVELLLWGLGIGIIPAVALGKLLADRWLPDPRVKIIKIDPEGPSIEPVRIPRKLWERREVIDLPIWQINEGETEAIVTEIDHMEDINKLKVRGVNPELANPISIAARDGQLSKVFGELIEAARDLNAQRGTEGIRQIEMEARVINEIIGAVESGTSIKPGAFEDVILNNGEKEPSGRTRTDEIKDGQTLQDVIGPNRNTNGEPVTMTAETDGGSNNAE